MPKKSNRRRRRKKLEITLQQKGFYRVEKYEIYCNLKNIPFVK